MTDVIGICSFLLVQHPLACIVLIGGILFMMKAEGSYEFVVFIVLMILAIYHDAIAKAKK